MTRGWKHAVEIHPEGWRFPAGKSWIAGWIDAGRGAAPTDVRARLHHRVILGLAGLPHPAFQKLTGDSSAAPTGRGFSFHFVPQAGATLLRLEGRNEFGQWVEFFRTAITAAPGAIEQSMVPNLAHSFARLVPALLKHRMRSPERSWNELADESMAEFVAEPLNADPNAPFLGALEEPHAIGRLRYGRIPVTGWLAHRTARIRRLTAVIDPQPPAALQNGFARPEIPAVFPELVGQTHAGFSGELALPPGLAGPVLLKVFAELEDGAVHLVFARRFTARQHGDIGGMPPQVSGRSLARAIWALHGSAGRHELPRRGWLRAAWAGRQREAAYRPKDRRRLPEMGALVTAGAEFPARPVCAVISSGDEMCVASADQYFRIGSEALRLVQHAIALAGNKQVERILDLPCGHGRVARWFRTAYPHAHLVVSDTLVDGVTFCAAHLNATGVPATVEGTHWDSLPGPYDVIWCGSLLTHFDRADWRNHLNKFAERLSSKGVVVFTSHGLPALELLRNGEKDYGFAADTVAALAIAAVAEGFGYAAYPATPGYGISIAQPGWVDEFIAHETDLRILDYRPAAWDEHQDVIVCTRR